MTTATPKKLYDPDDTTIEPSLRRLEQTLRWWSPIMLGHFNGITSIKYPMVYALSTVLGYAVFLIPSLVFATLAVDVVTGVSLFSTIATLPVAGAALVSLFSANFLFIGVGLTLLYGVLIVHYDIPQVLSSSVREPYEWQKLLHAVYIMVPVFIASAGLLLFTSVPYVQFGLLVASWWVLRRLTYTIVWDETRYMVDPDYTEWLLCTRLPWFVGLLFFVTGTSLTVAGVLFTVPFISTGGYLYWRKQQGSDTTQDLPTVRMVERSGLPEETTREYGKQAYSVCANHQAFVELVNKFNNLLETEIDTDQRVSISETPDSAEVKKALREVDMIYSNFSGVAYRPDRFEDLRNQMHQYGEQELDAMNYK